MDLSGVDLTTETIRTERLVLRPHRADDEDAIHAACQDPAVQRWISAIPSPYTREDARTFVRDVSPGDRVAGRSMHVAMDADGVLVGTGGLHFHTGRLGPEIGYWTAPAARGQGYAAEATRALARWAFDHGAPRVHLWVDVANAASQAAARRAGCVQEGVVRAVLEERDGSRRDAVLFGLVP